MPWPAELPSLFVAGSYGEEHPDGSLRSETDSGPGKSRPRPDKPNEMLHLSQYLTREQKARLIQFYNSDLTQGSLGFDEFHPDTQDTVTLRFRGGLRFDPVAHGMLWKADFTLEVIA